MFPPRLKKNTVQSMRGFSQTDPNHLRDLRHLRIDTQAQVADLVDILARGFIRLAEKRPHYTVSEPIAPLIRLDSPAPESPPVHRETPQWKRPCSVKSAGSGR